MNLILAVLGGVWLGLVRSGTVWFGWAGSGSVGFGKVWLCDVR